MDATQPLVQATVRHALSRGFLTAAQLREALILQQQLQEAGRPAALLSVLATRFLAPEHVKELGRFYRDQTTSDAAVEEVEPPKVEVPPDVLSRSCEMVAMPPEQDPEPVRRMLAESAREEDIPDKLFLGLAKKAGYPSREELQGCRAAQLEHARSGRAGPGPSLYALACARGLLDTRKQRRFLRWAAQVQGRAAEPLEEEAEARQEERGARILAVSAASFDVETPRCASCNAELDEFAVMEERASVVEGKTLCSACGNRAAAARPPVALSAPPPPAAPVGSSSGAKDAPAPTVAASGKRGRKIARALRASAAILLGRAAPAKAGDAPRAGRQGVTVAIASGAAALIALLLTIAVIVATSGPPPPPPRSPADDAWARLRELRASEARAGLLSFARDHAADPRAADATAFAALLEATAQQGAERERKVVDALLTDARERMTRDPAGALAALLAIEGLSPGNEDADLELRALRGSAGRVVGAAREGLLLRAREDPDGALREALDQALRWRGLGQDTAFEQLVLDVARERSGPAPPPDGRPRPPPAPTPPTSPTERAPAQGSDRALRAAFDGGRFDEARALARELTDEAAREVWRTLLDPLDVRGSLAAKACQTLSAGGRHRVVTDVGTDMRDLHVRLLRAKDDEEDAAIARARGANRALLAIATLLDDAAKGRAALLPGEPRERVVTSVYVFSTREGLDDFTATLGGGDWRVVAVHEEDPAGARSAGAALSPRTQERLLREAARVWLAQQIAAPPPWLEAGLAAYCGLARTGPDGLTLGRVDPARHELLLKAVERGDLPLGALLRADRATFARKAALNEAHAWSVVQHLAANANGQQLLRDYVQALRAGKGAEAAFDASFDRIDLAELEGSWRVYIEALR